MPFKALNQVSDLFFAIGDAIHAAGLGVDVVNYDEWDGTVRHAAVLIEIERTTPGERQNDGRYTHAVTVSLHAVVARYRKHAALEAINLATCLERLTDNNRWGFHGSNCEMPSEARSGPSMFQRGADGYDAWAATFKQIVTPGERPTEILINTAPLVAFSWQVDDLDNPENYHQLEV